MNALDQYLTKDNMAVPRYAIERAVLNLGKIEALALIRASFLEEDGGYATLKNAKLIYQVILNTYSMPEAV